MFTHLNNNCYKIFSMTYESHIMLLYQTNNMSHNIDNEN